MSDITGYDDYDGGSDHCEACLLPTVERLLRAFDWGDRRPRRIFDLGCGNGVTAAHLTQLGYDVTGVDPSTAGIALAHQHYPALKLHAGSSEDDLPARYGEFPVVYSLEVIEHIFLPGRFTNSVFRLLEPGGLAILSTPYHGYLKNLAIALAGRMDDHYKALWNYGHIKFWSIPTLTMLLHGSGFVDLRFFRVGRIPPLARSMVVAARKPRSPRAAPVP